MGCNLEFCAGRSTDALMSRWSYLRLLACICCWDWDQPENKRVMRIIINGCTFRGYKPTILSQNDGSLFGNCIEKDH